MRKLSYTQTAALQYLSQAAIPEGSPHYKAGTLLSLEARGLAKQAHYANGVFFEITNTGREELNPPTEQQLELKKFVKNCSKAFNKLKITATAAGEAVKDFGQVRKIALVLIFALTATISYEQKLPNLSSAIIGQTITIDEYKVVKDTVKSNLIISITGSPALIVTEGYVIRERVRVGDSWVMRANGLFYTDRGYLDVNKKPFSHSTLVWQAKVTE